MKPSKRILAFALSVSALFFLWANEAGAQGLSNGAWKSYPIGATGLFLDLPKAPDPAHLVNGTMTSGVYTGAMAVDVREVMSTAYDPEFASRQMLTILQAWPKHENVQGQIVKRIINGLEARLLLTTHKNGSFLNHRNLLLIYSYDRFWAIDAIAAENERDQIERVIGSAAVRLPLAAGLQRQQIGSFGASLVVGPKVLEVKRKDKIGRAQSELQSLV